MVDIVRCAHRECEAVRILDWVDWVDWVNRMDRIKA